jgi:hypothetical protein
VSQSPEIHLISDHHSQPLNRRVTELLDLFSQSTPPTGELKQARNLSVGWVRCQDISLNTLQYLKTAYAKSQIQPGLRIKTQSNSWISLPTADKREV